MFSDLSDIVLPPHLQQRSGLALLQRQGLSTVVPIKRAGGHLILSTIFPRDHSNCERTAGSTIPCSSNVRIVPDLPRIEVSPTGRSTKLHPRCSAVVSLSMISIACSLARPS